MNREIADLAEEGWAIHLEGVKEDGRTDSALRWAFRQMFELQKVVVMACPNLVHQRVHFIRPKRAQVIDLTLGQIIDRMRAQDRAVLLAKIGAASLLVKPSFLSRSPR